MTKGIANGIEIAADKEATKGITMTVIKIKPTKAAKNPTKFVSEGSSWKFNLLF